MPAARAQDEREEAQRDEARNGPTRGPPKSASTRDDCHAPQVTPKNRIAHFGVTGSTSP
jgi:hypothetical protein